MFYLNDKKVYSSCMEQYQEYIKGFNQHNLWQAAPFNYRYLVYHHLLDDVIKTTIEQCKKWKDDLNKRLQKTN